MVTSDLLLDHALYTGRFPKRISHDLEPWIKIKLVICLDHDSSSVTLSCIRLEC